MFVPDQHHFHFSLESHIAHHSASLVAETLCTSVSIMIHILHEAFMNGICKQQHKHSLR